MRKIYTTISVDSKMRVKLGYGARKKALLKEALNRAVKCYGGTLKRKAVCRQKFITGMCRIAISIPDDTYEILTDARSFGKFSVSYMIGEVLKELLEKKDDIHNHNFDNYRNYGYDARISLAGGMIKFEVMWKKEAS